VTAAHAIPGHSRCSTFPGLRLTNSHYPDCTYPAISAEAPSVPQGQPSRIAEPHPPEPWGTVQPGPAPVALSEQARIVIVRFSSLGDVVKATGLPRQIRARYPGAHLTMVTSEAFVPLIAGNPHLDRAVGFERREGLAGLWRLARELRQSGVDLMVDIHRSLRSRLLARWVGAPGVPYSKRTVERALRIGFGLRSGRPPRRKEQDFAAALSGFGVLDDGLGPEISLAPLLADPEAAKRFAEPLGRLRAWREGGFPVIGLAPVAAWELKRWPLTHFQALAEGFLRETGGGLVIFGGSADEDARALAESLGPHALSLAGATTLLEAAWFASLCDLMVCNDTGMGHLAEAVGRDAIVLFGPTSEELGYFPSRPGSRAVQLDLPCRPCTRMGEGRCTHPLRKACLEGIGPERVLDEVLRGFAASARSRP
jgi:heptosyltransferase-2